MAPVIDVQLRLTRGQLRVFGAVAAALFAALGALAAWRGSLVGIDLGTLAARVAAVLWVAAAGAAAGALLYPPALRPLHLAIVIITYPIGWAVSHLLMALLFYALLTPIGLLFRLLGRDSLARRVEPAAPSYWEEHPPADKIERYFRQY